jgi:hypothetical protein
MDHARFHFFQPVRFFADVNDSFDSNVSAAQQPNGLFAARLSLGIRALRAGMEFILAQYFPVRLYPSSVRTNASVRRSKKCPRNLYPGCGLPEGEPSGMRST